MTGFVHGIRVLEIDGSAAFGWPAIVPDLSAPRILSPSRGAIDEGDTYSILLVADRPVTFEIRPGADGALFAIDDDHLTLPSAEYDPDHQTLICRLRAIDALGGTTDFEHAVSVFPAVPPPPGAGGQLDFSKPENSALQ